MESLAAIPMAESIPPMAEVTPQACPRQDNHDIPKAESIPIPENDKRRFERLRSKYKKREQKHRKQQRVTVYYGGDGLDHSGIPMAMSMRSIRIRPPRTTISKIKRTQQNKSKDSRQRGATSRSSAKSGDSNDGDGDGGEPPRPQYYTYATFAQLVDCTKRTLYNKVSTGQFPRPVKTVFGPRFTQQHLDFVVKSSPPKRRGRPRIAKMGRGGAA